MPARPSNVFLHIDNPQEKRSKNQARDLSSNRQTARGKEEKPDFEDCAGLKPFPAATVSVAIREYYNVVDRINFRRQISTVKPIVEKGFRQGFCSAVFLSLFLFGVFDGLGQTGMTGRPFSSPVRFPTCVAYGNGIFVAAGGVRLILVSKDGTNWMNRSAAVPGSTIGINFTTENYTVGGDSLTLVTPNDASTNVEIQQKPFQFRAVGFGNNTFVILGESGEILISPDGESWRTVNAPTSANFTGIAWGGDKFVAVSDAGTIFTSTDGVRWTLRNSGTDKTLDSVAFGNGIFVTVGGDMDNSVILTSNDGVTWIPNAVNYSCPMRAIAYYSSEFTTGPGYGSSLTMASRDGKNWREVKNWREEESHSFYTLRNPAFSRAVAHGKGVFVAATGTDLMTSNDGVHWYSDKMPPKRMLCGRMAGASMFWAFPSLSFADSAPTPTLHTWDGQIWTTFPKNAISGNIDGNRTQWNYPNSKPGQDFAVLTSDDGITWTRLLPASAPNTNPVASAVVTANTAVPIMSSVGIAFQLNGQSYKLNLSARAGEVYELQASTDLEHWVNLTTMTNNGQAFNFMDQDAAKYPQRFYRLKLQQ